jgi:hypothetical protein
VVSSPTGPPLSRPSATTATAPAVPPSCLAVEGRRESLNARLEPGFHVFGGVSARVTTATRSLGGNRGDLLRQGLKSMISGKRPVGSGPLASWIGPARKPAGALPAAMMPSPRR